MPSVPLTPLQEITAVLVLASAVGMLGLALRQPMIVSFILVGVMVGPSALHLVRSPVHLELLADIGVSVLLFLIGLKLDLALVRSLGKVAVATGLGQVVFTSLVGYALCAALGIGPIQALYIAVALTFSSTIIVVKLLSDKREMDSLHGRIALGFLVVQDVVVVVAMVALSAWGIRGPSGGTDLPLRVVGGAVVMLVAMLVVVRRGADRILRRLSSVPDLMITAAIAWAIAGSAVSDSLGFGRELGGLLAGVSLASATMREAIASRLSSLRDFLLLFFFVGLGSRLDVELLGAQLGAGLALSLFVLVGNPLIVMLIMRLLGYSKRTGFLAGLTVAQISEFSFIFVAKGRALGHLGRDDVGIVTLVGLVTITVSTYMILYSHSLYAKLAPLLRVFDLASPAAEPPEASTEPADVILVGLGRFGGGIARLMRGRGLRVLGVDFDPEVVRRLAAEGIPTIYGDAEDEALAERLPLAAAKWVIVTFPVASLGVVAPDPRRVLMHALEARGFRGEVAVTSHDPRDIESMRESGAAVVLVPYEEAARGAVEHIARSIQSGT